MGNTFSFDRLRLLIYKHAVENWKLYIISFIVMSIPIYISNGQMNRDKNLYLFSSYLFLMIVTGGIYTGMFFTKWTDKAKGSTYILLPALAFEKIALVFFCTVLIFVPLYTCVFYLESLLLTQIYYPGGAVWFMEQSGEHSNIYRFISEAIVPYLFFQSLFLLSNIWFKNRQTFLVLIYLAFSYLFVPMCNGLYLGRFSGNIGTLVRETFVLFAVTVSYSGIGDYTLFTSPLIAGISIPVIVIITILIYMAAYFKLKEKEI
jgi:hypothetical protein